MPIGNSTVPSTVVEYETLYRLVLNKIRECAKAALMDGEAVAGRLTNTCEAEQKGQREALERSLTKHEERIEVLEKNGAAAL